MPHDSRSSQRREEQDAQILDKLIVDAAMEDRQFRFVAWCPRVRHDLTKAQKAGILRSAFNSQDYQRLTNIKSYSRMPAEKLLKLAWQAESPILRAANVNKGFVAQEKPSGEEEVTA